MSIKVTLEAQADLEVEKKIAEVKEKLKNILYNFANLEGQKQGITEDQNELKKEAFRILKEETQGINWNKKGLSEAFRLAKMPKEDRDVMLTQASSILRDMGVGEIDLHTFG